MDHDDVADDQSPVIDPEQLKRFPCTACGGQLAWDATSRSMRCGHCGQAQSLEVAEGSIEEVDFERALKEGVGRGYGVSRKSLRCENCGAITSYDDVAVSVRCTFCDNSHVVQFQSAEEVVRPASLVPFGVDKKQALEGFKAWISSRWLSPGSLQKMWALGQIDGVYLPYWTFDAATASRWTAMAGYYHDKQVRYSTVEEGKTVWRTRTEREVHWRPAAGFYDHTFDDELVYASQGLPRELLRALEPYDTQQGLVVYRPDYLAGWKAERYSVDLAEGWKVGRRQMEEMLREWCASQIPGDTYKDLRVNTRFSQVTFKHVLLPVWVAAYHYQGKLYRFMVNGQTGQVSGEAPLSWIKVTLLVLLAAGLLFLFYTLSNSHSR